MAVLSISRQFGAGGKTLGESVALELGYKFLHETMMDKLAQEIEKKPEANGHPDMVMELLASLGPVNFIESYAGSGHPEFNEKRHLESLTTVINELAAYGNIVLLGRGSQFILRYHKKTIKVLLVAELEHRVDFMVKTYGLEPLEARNMITQADKKRQRFLRHFYPGEPDESSLYHMALNTSLVPLDTARDQMCKLVRRMEKTWAGK
ncbi:MAG: cytidylate kinase-like family protein [Deltaproteobacteria bacterium]|nr:cytidylate kinase-like family protein [Deltaproteobacteria bacterium]